MAARVVAKQAFVIAVIAGMLVLLLPRLRPLDYHQLIPFQDFSVPAAMVLWKDVPELRWKACPWWVAPNPSLANVAEKSNGYIIVECYGGLNQMRRDLCNGVGIAKLLNATFLLPQFDASLYWNDTSGFADIFDVEFFIEHMKGWVQIAREVSPAMTSKIPYSVQCHKRNMPFDYVEEVLPALLRHGIVVLRPAASQRADRYPVMAKRARCEACFRALRLVKHLQDKATVILHQIPRPFVALHLRFEPDMVAYSRCIYNDLANTSAVAIDAARGGRKPWEGKLQESWRKRGKCPLTPREAVFLLRALRIPTTMPVYLAAGSGLLEKESFTETFAVTHTKLSLLGKDVLRKLRGNSRAAIDYYVSLHSDVYIATFFGNMDKMVVAERVLAGRQKTLVLNRKAFAEATWKSLGQKELAKLMWHTHKQALVSGHALPLPDCFCG